MNLQKDNSYGGGSYTNPAYAKDFEEIGFECKEGRRQEQQHGAPDVLVRGKPSSPRTVNFQAEVQEPSESQNPIVRLIHRHYSTKPNPKSEAQLHREQYLIPGLILFNRWFLMPAAITTQFCCGSLYAWSVFNKPIEYLLYGEIVNLAPITFYVAILFFGLSTAVMGPWLERHGPLPACLLGTCLFFTGNLITALALFLKQIWLVFIGYGVICGFGIGLCYISPVSALQKWFPDKRGLASGFAVCGFGAGSIVISKVQIPLIELVGLPFTFIVLGAIYFVLMMCSALVLRTPPPSGPIPTSGAAAAALAPAPQPPSDELNQSKPGTATPDDCPDANPSAAISMSLVEAISSRTFRLMYIMFFTNTLFGLVLISRLSNMVTDIFGRSANEASTIVSINGGFNLGGRLVMSILSDYIGRKNCYVIMLTTQLVIIGSFSTITDSHNYAIFLCTMWLLTACYGAGFGVIPAFLTDKFGTANIGACHGIILTAWSGAAIIGGLVFTAIFDSIIRDGLATLKEPYAYNVNVWWIFGVVLIGWVTALFIEPTAKDAALIRKLRSAVKALMCCCGGGGGGCGCGGSRKGQSDFTQS